jgi:phenylalanine-4-hydroxylase
MEIVAPVAGLRGQYTGMAPDWTVPQAPEFYSDEDQAVWRLLVERQTALAKDFACAEFLRGLETLGVSDSIPDFESVNARLEPLTGWKVVGVPGLIPDAVFYDHLAHRRFPATVWIRKRSELDYLVEPDLFHDFFGHVPLLSDPVFADFMQRYGQRAAEAGPHLDLLARLYWYTVEFGLIRDGDGLKLYGAGIVSSFGESKFALDDPSPNRLGFDLKRLMRTKYRIDDYQQNYFVIDSFDDLLRQTRETDFGPLYQELADQPEIEIETILPTDKVYTRGTQAYARGKARAD